MKLADLRIGHSYLIDLEDRERYTLLGIRETGETSVILDCESQDGQCRTMTFCFYGTGREIGEISSVTTCEKTKPEKISDFAIGSLVTLAGGPEPEMDFSIGGIDGTKEGKCTIISLDSLPNVQ